MSEPAITLTDVHKAFDGRPVLKGVSLSVPAGETCVVLGQSGSGKTVLLKIVMGLIRPERGSVVLHGQEMVGADEATLANVRSSLGIAFQAGALFDSLTVAENIAFPLKERLQLPAAEIEAKVTRALELIRLTGHGHKYPAELSGGMQKRAAFARAIVMEPRILLLDEPTAGLDPTNTELITDELISAKKTLGSTSLTITYNLQSAFRMADAIALLHEGTIVAHDTPAAIKRSNHPAVKAFLRDWNERERHRRG